MAVYPTAGGSSGTWGAECRSYHDISTDLATGKVKDGAVFQTSAAPTVDAGVANKKYVDDSTGFSEVPVNGVDTKVYTKYLMGTLAAGATVNIAHGVTAANILHVSTIVFSDVEAVYRVSEMFRANVATIQLAVKYDATNITFELLGSQLQENAYRIKIDYTQ